MRFAIVGGGLSGANTLKGILSHPNFSPNDKVDLYEPSESIGPGFPYQTKEDDAIVLNTPPGVNSQIKSNPDDFIEWLDENYEKPTNLEGLVSRKRYGKYLIEHFAPYVNHPQVTHFQQTVESLEVLDSTLLQHAKDYEDHSLVYRLKTNQGWQSPIYDAVFLCIGHPPYNDFYNLYGNDHFIHNPYPMVEKLSPLSNDQNIAVVGSGATGVDIMRFLMTHYELNSPLTFFDIEEPIDPVTIPYKAGKVHLSMTKKWISTEKEKHAGFIPLSVIVQKILSDLQREHVDLLSVYNRYKSNTLEARRSAFESNDQELAAAQKYFSQLVPFLPELYNALNLDDRKDYMENYHSILDFFKTRVPNLTYKWIFELADSGKLKGHSDLKDIEELADGSFRIITQTGSYEVDVIINATGFDTKLEHFRKHSPLINNLYNDRIILPQDNGRFVLIDWPSSRVMNQRFGLMENLFFQGALIAGTQHENNDIGMISRHALHTAKSFMNRVNH